MGIPSYFSHIIRNYSNIIRSLKYFQNGSVNIEHLFMDCNSIVYDIVRSIEFTGDKGVFEDLVIESIIEKIKMYIDYIQPTKSIFIAFDGVAPFAKMEQQRTRRHKTLFMNNIDFDNKPDKVKTWDTSAITPGTDFMDKLSQRLNYAFSYTNNIYGVDEINVSASCEPGEGEHKLFDYLRKNDLSLDNIALYGLDSDLIMLSIFHINQCKNIYIFREAPEFVKNMLPIGTVTDNNEPYFLDIELLSSSIIEDMHCCDRDIYRVYDYVFLCFLLGNDFLPHFPAMNIRTHGISVLLDVYTKTVGNVPNNFIITSNFTINWKNLRKVLTNIAKDETKYLLEEYSKRKRFDSYKYPESTREEKERLFQNVPTIYRSQETYISPENEFWESRYYKTLFKQEPNDDFLKTVSINYIEGLEWVFKYYTTGCISWRWKYDYIYPPLFKDLIKFIPHFEMDFVKPDSLGPFHPYTQLSYVLPLDNHFLLPDKISKFLKYNYNDCYASDYKFEWAFCRYFWESHPVLPDIPLKLLEKWDTQIQMFVQADAKN